MKILTTTDQQTCRTILTAFDLLDSAKPRDGCNGADGLLRIDQTMWLVICMSHGQYTLHALEDATEVEAWGFFDALRAKPGWKTRGNRLVILPE